MGIFYGYNVYFHFRTLKKAVEDLEENGRTALGPALSVCCGMVQNSPSSEVILCTDGQPNIALGTLSGGSKDPEHYVKVRITTRLMYPVFRLIKPLTAVMKRNIILQMGDFAKDHSFTISIIAIEGEEVELDCVSKCASISGGDINVLHPLELMREIRLLGQNPVIAHDVSIKFMLHPLMNFDPMPGQKVNLYNLKRNLPFN